MVTHTRLELHHSQGHEVYSRTKVNPTQQVVVTHLQHQVPCWLPSGYKVGQKVQKRGNKKTFLSLDSSLITFAYNVSFVQCLL